MKIGIRKPNIKKSIKARTTGKIKRAVKKSINPFYGKRGAGFVKNPVKSVKNSVYHKTTVGISDIARSIGGSSSTAAASGSSFIPATHTLRPFPLLPINRKRRKAAALSLAAVSACLSGALVCRRPLLTV